MVDRNRVCGLRIPWLVDRDPIGLGQEGELQGQQDHDQRTDDEGRTRLKESPAAGSVSQGSNVVSAQCLRLRIKQCLMQNNWQMLV